MPGDSPNEVPSGGLRQRKVKPDQPGSDTEAEKRGARQASATGRVDTTDKGPDNCASSKPDRPAQANNKLQGRETAPSEPAEYRSGQRPPAAAGRQEAAHRVFEGAGKCNSADEPRLHEPATGRAEPKEGAKQAARRPTWTDERTV